MKVNQRSRQDSNVSEEPEESDAVEPDEVAEDSELSNGPSENSELSSSEEPEESDDAEEVLL